MIFVKKNIILFFTFFFISTILGYDSLNRFDHDRLLSKEGNLSDISSYKKVVEDGFNGFKDETRIAPRIITPIISHYVYKTFTNQVRSWHEVFFSLLMVNSFFVAAMCMIMMSYLRYLNIAPTLSAQFLFLCSFGVSAFHLSGLIDSSISFFIFLYILSYLKKKYFISWLVSILICLSKETSFIYLFIFHTAFLLNECYFEKKIKIEDIAFPIVNFLTNIIIINFYIINYLQMNIYEYIFHFQIEGGAVDFDKTLIDIPKFFRFFIPIIFFLYIGLKRVSKKFASLIIMCTVIHLIFLTLVIDLDGNGMGRYMFTFLGPLFCVISGIGLDKMLKKYKKTSNSKSTNN